MNKLKVIIIIIIITYHNIEHNNNIGNSEGIPKCNVELKNMTLILLEERDQTIYN